MPYITMPRTLLASSLVLVVLLLLAGCTAPQDAPSEDTASQDATATAPDVSTRIQEANRLIGEEKYGEAAEILEAVVAEAPDNTFATLQFGRALRRDAQTQRALDVLTKGTEMSPIAGPALSEVFFVHAEQKDLDKAAEAYERLGSTPGVDWSGLHLDDSLENLRSDERFAGLFPAPEVFEDPFVEGRAVIHDWHGEEPGHQHGWIARNIGDVDGDGVDDAVSSAPATQPNSDSSGLVYAYSGKTGAELWRRTAEPGDQLGMGVEGAGDVNADGVPDVIAGAPGAGRAYVYSGKDGTTLLTFEAGDDDGSTFANVAGVGDADGDGHDDLIVGVPSSNVAGPGAGRAYVYSGKDGSVLAAWDGEESGDAYGSAVDGKTDATGTYIVVGAPGAGENNAGRAYVYKDLSGTPAFVIEPGENNRQLGAMFVSIVGDTDGDGVQDVYASDWSAAGKGPSTGAVYVHSGKDGSRLIELEGESAGDGFGIGVARAGDTDDDGHDDLIVGAWQHASAAHSGGKLYVYSGKDATLMATYTGKIPGETLGFDTDGMGDVDGDGRIDYLVTSAWSVINGTRSGRTLLISGRIEGP